MNTWSLLHPRPSQASASCAYHYLRHALLCLTFCLQENQRKANEEYAELAQQAEITEADLKSQVTCIHGEIEILTNL